MRRCIGAVMLIFILSTDCLGAEENLMTDVIYLEPVTVTGEAEEENLNTSSLRVQEKSRSNNIADYLFNDTEISFKRKSSMGDSGDVISIRGFESKRIMLNLDGRNISSTGIAGGNYIDFSTIPLDNIERLEIIKGGSSIEYGNNALGGVINAYTKAPTEDPSFNFYATTGGWEGVHDFHNIRAAYAQKWKGIGVSVGGSHQQADAYLRNNDYDSTHIYPKLYVDLPGDGKLTLGYNYSDTERGLIRSNRDDGVSATDTDPTLPGFDTAIDSDYPVNSGEYFAGGAPTPSMNIIGDGAYWEKKRHLLDLNYHQNIGKDGYIDLVLFKNHETRVERNYADVAARTLAEKSPMDTFNDGAAQTRDGDLVFEREITVDNSWGGKFKLGWDFDSHAVLAGVEYKVMDSGGTEVNYVDTNYNCAGPNGWTGAMADSSDGPDAYITGIFLGDKYAVTDRLVLDFGLRYDSYAYEPEGSEEQENSQLSPKATVTYAIDESQTITLAAYMNYRTPTMPEAYWGAQGKLTVPYLSGVDLKPESEVGFDLAYQYRFQNSGFIKLAAYYYDIKDYIIQKSVYVNTASGSTWATLNTDAVIYGLTAAAGCPFSSTTRGQISATYQETEKTNDPSDPDGVLEKIDYIPNLKATAGLSWDILNNLVLDVTLNYIGDRDYTISTAQTTKGTLDEYWLLGASLRYQLDKHTTIELYGDNLTDSDYEESWGYPAMGVNVGVSVKWAL